MYWVTQFTSLIRLGDPPEPEVQPWFPLTQQSGLTGLRDLHWDGVDHVFLSALAEHWTPKTNNFHFFFGEFIITLHDVYCLLGLPMDGRARVAPERLGRLEVIEMFGLETRDVSSTTFHQGRAFKKIHAWVVGRGEVEAQR